jgi:glycosyltransferase involved in cell wall biosynthesis
MRLSASIITTNKHQKYLEGCLKSIKDIANEIVIVFTDKITKLQRELIKKYKVKVLNYKWDKNFSNAHNYGLKHCKGDWILVIDSDERLEGNIIPLLEKEDIDAWDTNQLHDDGTIVNSVRLFRNNLGMKFEGKIHESIKGKNVRLGKTNVTIRNLKKRNKKQEKENLKSIKEAIQFESDVYKKKYYEGLFKIEEGKYFEAIGIFEDVIANVSDGIGCFIRLLIMDFQYTYMNYYKNAFLENANKCIDKIPEQNSIYMTLCRFYESEGDYEKALMFGDKLLSRVGNNISALQNDKIYTKEFLTDIKNKIKEKQNGINSNER